MKYIPNMNPQAIIIQKFRSPPDQVFDAFLNPDLIGQWMFGPQLRDEKIIHLQIQPKVGGAFSFLVNRHGQDIDHVGYYLEINRPHRLVFSWGVQGSESSHVMIDIDTIENGSELTLTHEIPTQWSVYLERTKDGWTKMLRLLEIILKDKN